MLLRNFANGLSQFSYDKIGNFLIFLIELKSILLNLLITLLNFTFSGFDVIFLLTFKVLFGQTRPSVKFLLKFCNLSRSTLFNHF